MVHLKKICILVEIIPVVLEKFFENFINVFLLFHNYLPLEKGRTLHLNTFASPSPKDALCQVWLKMVHRSSDSGEEDENVKGLRIQTTTDNGKNQKSSLEP